ncbi:MAG: TetR/AcrR family transcriptional regulator [Treponema sp.]|jgi:AcrR family transcriptional regulator|nr:TetR/AcrR family transcriptional regulator [Treponema sp.]
MAIAVEHEKRRKEILGKALMVFMDDGFSDATFQKIADRCGITRTILYLYFKDKKEIFKYSIKQFLTSVEEDIKTIKGDNSLNIIEKITRILLGIMSLMEQNRQLLSVVLDYLMHITKSSVDPETRLRHRTVRFRRILANLVIEGVKTGELKKVNIKTADDYLYSFIESAIFQITVLKRKNIDDLKDTTVFAVRQFSV